MRATFSTGLWNEVIEYASIMSLQGGMVPKSPHFSLLLFLFWRLKLGKHSITELLITSFALLVCCCFEMW